MAGATEPRVELLGPEAIPDVHALWARAGLVFRPDGRDSTATFTKELEQTSSFLLGVYEGDRVVGVALGSDDGRKGWINRVAVLPDHRRAGIGRAFIRACEAVFEERGIGIVACLIEETNAGSLDFFAAAGYEIHHDIAYLRKPIAGADW